MLTATKMPESLRPGDRVMVEGVARTVAGIFYEPDRIGVWFVEGDGIVFTQLDTPVTVVLTA